MDSADDLIRWNRELRALAAAVCEEAQERRATYIAIWERNLDLLPRVRATRSVSAAIRMKRWTQPSNDGPMGHRQQRPARTLAAERNDCAGRPCHLDRQMNIPMPVLLRAPMSRR
jgi:hypothetical protein